MPRSKKGNKQLSDFERYLAEVRRIPPMDNTEQNRLFSTLHATRKKLSRLVFHLWEPLRSEVIGGKYHKGLLDRDWTLTMVDRISSRLSENGRQSRGVRLSRVAQMADALCRTIRATRDRAVEATLGLAALYTRKLERRGYFKGLSLFDLIQEANIGLMRAAWKFNHRRGVKFSTYAMACVRQQIQRTLHNTGRTIRLPVRVQGMIARIRKEEQRLAHRLGRSPTLAEIAKLARIRKDTVERLRLQSRETVHLEDMVSDDTDSGRRVAQIADQSIESLDQQVLHRELRGLLAEMMRKLSVRGEIVLRLRFGWDDGIDRTMDEVGQGFKVSRERIKQHEHKALRKLRELSLTTEFKHVRDFLA